MAEGYFRHQLKFSDSPIVVNSAGIGALVNHAADLSAQKVMLEHGINISTHKGLQLTDILVRKFSLILVMTYQQLNFLSSHFMSATGKTFLLGHWSQFEIQDPYKQPYNAFEKTFQQIELAWQDWKTRILACHVSE